MKQLFAILLLAYGLPGLAADDETMRLSGRMLFPYPELAKAGACVMYREGGSGWILTEPVYWLRGTVISSEIRNRRFERCPEVPKPIEQYTRDEFNRLVNSQPCVSRDDAVRDESRGMIRFRVEAWETPYARKMANAGRLYQGYFVDKKLEKGTELEVEAPLLGACK